MDIIINNKRFTMSQATINNKTDVEMAKFCADSDDPVVRELAYRLGKAHSWNIDCEINGHDSRAVISAKGFTVSGVETGRFSTRLPNKGNEPCSEKIN